MQVAPFLEFPDDAYNQWHMLLATTGISDRWCAALCITDHGQGWIL